MTQMVSGSARLTPADHVPLPTVRMSDWNRERRWWKPETGIPRRCVACNARLMVDPPLWERYGRVACLVGCGREVAYISSVGWHL